MRAEPRFSLLRGLQLGTLVVFPPLAWWLSYNFHACGAAGVHLAIAFLPFVVFAALVPAAALILALAFVPTRLSAERLIAIVGIETMCVVLLYFLFTIHQHPSGACAV